MLRKPYLALAMFAIFASGSLAVEYFYSNSDTTFGTSIWNMSESIAAPSTDLTTDVKQAKTANNRFMIVRPGLSNTANIAALPTAFQSYGWRTNAPVIGPTGAANWTVSYKLQDRTGSTTAFSGRINAKVWQSVNANMSGATNLTNWIPSLNVMSFSGTVGEQLTDSISFAMPALNLEAFIYVEFAWDIITATGNGNTGFFFVVNENLSTESLAIPLRALNTPTLVLTNPDIGKNNPADNATMACSVTCSGGACTNLNLWVEYNPGAGFTAIPTAATGGLRANAGTFSCGSVSSCSNSWSVEGLSNATFPVRCAANSTTPSSTKQSASQNIAVYAGLLTAGSFLPASPFSVSIFDAVNISGTITCQSPSVAKAGCGNATLTARAGAVTANTQISGSTTPSLISGTSQQSCASQFPVADGGSYSCPFSQITVNMTAGNGNGDTRFWDIYANSTDTQVTPLDPTDQQIIGRVGNATVAVTSGTISLNTSDTFSINATVTCASFRCVNVSAYARYNATTAVPDTPFLTAPNSVPAWLTANPLSCPTMNPGGTCTPVFNGTADNVTGTWLYDVLANATVVGVPSLNSSSSQLAIGRPLPDLNITNADIVLNNSNIYENDTVQINATFRNSGVLAATNVNVTYYINTTQQCSFIVPSMPVGATNTTTCSWNATTFGNYTITVAVDPANAILERNETNNNATANVTVNRRLADLMMNASSLSLNSTSPITGDVVQINATVFNIGNVTAANVNITYYAINATNASTALCSFTVPSLTVGASNTTTCSWNASTAGDFTITAAADPGNTIPETNETNNNASTSVSVGARTNLTLSDATDTANIPPNVQITFYANYTTVPAGAPVTGAACAISIPFFNISANMTYNATSALYRYNTSFAVAGTFTWNATCSRTGFQTQSANKSFTVTSFAFVVTDKASYTNCNRVYYRISLFNLTDSSADDALTVEIRDAAGALRQSTSNYTSGGAHSGAYAFTSPLVTGTWTIKANTSCVLQRRNFTVGEGNQDMWKIDVFFSPDQGGYASGTTITITSYVYNLHGTGAAGLGANVSANVDGGSVALTDNGLGRYTATYLTAASGAHYFEIRAINGTVNVTNRRGFFVR